MNDKEIIEIVRSEAELLLSKLGFKNSPEITIETDSKDSKFVKVDINGDDLGIIIGYRGDNLRALQLVLNLIVSKKIEDHAPVIVDVNGYQKRREESVIEMIEGQVKRLRDLGTKEYVLRPMNSGQRRIIHKYIATLDDVVSRSEDEGKDRHIVLTFE